jgi:hypothetical protein
MTSDEARGLLAESEQPPTVRWRDKRGGWRFARLVKVGRVWATVESGGDEFGTHSERVKVEVLQRYVRRR